MCVINGGAVCAVSYVNQWALNSLCRLYCMTLLYCSNVNCTNLVCSRVTLHEIFIAIKTLFCGLWSPECKQHGSHDLQYDTKKLLVSVLS